MSSLFPFGKTALNAALSYKGARFSIYTLPVLRTNYQYLLVDNESKRVGVIDPVDSCSALSYIKYYNLQPECVLTTHDHWDHDSGTSQFVMLLKNELKQKQNIKVFSGKGDKAQGATDFVGDGDSIKLGDVEVNVLDTKFHTPGHVCYYVGSGSAGEGPGAVFTGDTMFIAGCGALNNGTKDQLFAAFNKLGKLPKETLVYGGHEITLDNLKFALAVEPGNSKTLKKYKELVSQIGGAIAEKMPLSVPSTIQSEHDTNPFMRAAFDASIEIAETSGIYGNSPASNAERILWVRQYKSSGEWKAKWEAVKSQFHLT